MKYTVFAGCSYTAGTGFELEKEDPVLWANQLYKKYFDHTQKLNLAKSGRSNQNIFQDTVRALVTIPVAYAIVEWTNMPRYEVELGFELYPTRQVFAPNIGVSDREMHNLKYSSDYLSSIRDRFTSLAHPCSEIISVVSYVNIILNLAKFTNTKIFFVNGLCPWDENFFNKQHNVLPNEYTLYTQQILDVETRSDQEAFALYDKLHKQFEDEGGINEDCWLNLYQPLRTKLIDVNSDKMHPGAKSNDLYFNMLSESIDQQL
jgi:hypothetical protein